MATRKRAASRPTAATGKAPAAHAGPLTRRWTEQRWTIDNTIRSVGMDWDQPRSSYLSAPCGPQALGDFAAVRQDRKSTRLNSSHTDISRMPSSA